MMKDSKIDVNWLKEMMRACPPQIRPNGAILSGPVRLCFPNIFKPGKAKGSTDGAEPKYGAAVLFPLGTDMSLFEKIWTEEAKKSFPKSWDDKGQPIGLHIPFHDQAEKAFGVNPYAGYTPGAIYFNVSSKYKPPVVDANMNPVGDETRIYPGVWAILSFNVYAYGISPPQPKKGIGFGLQTVMLIADDQKLGGGGGDPTKDFAGIHVTAQTNIAAKFDAAATAQPQQQASIMPAGGHVGQSPPTLPAEDLTSLM